MADERKHMVYPNGDYCAHCLWIEHRYPRDYRGPKIGYPYWIDPGFGEVVVFQSGSHFQYTFNCVLKQHSYTDISALFRGATRFIEFLFVKFGIVQTRLLINSDYKARQRTKEHLHALITMNSPEDIAKFRQHVHNGPARDKVSSAPYPGDSVVPVARVPDLIRSEDAWLVIGKLLGLRPGQLNKRSFYIFLQYSCDPHHPTIAGQISYSPKQWEAISLTER